MPIKPMRTLRARPLLAVAAFSVIACSSGGAVGPEPEGAPALQTAPPQPIVPRVMPSGRPACGNVTARSPHPKDC